jgi:hypothetical protein
MYMVQGRHAHYLGIPAMAVDDGENLAGECATNYKDGFHGEVVRLASYVLRLPTHTARKTQDVRRKT